MQFEERREEAEPDGCGQWGRSPQEAGSAAKRNVKKMWRTDEFTDLLQGFVEAHEEVWRQELLQFEQRKASLLPELEKDAEDVAEVTNFAR